MTSNTPFAMFFNASPRKGWNTYKMLEAAKAGAEEAGAVTELVNLYDIKFPGCRSCFETANIFTMNIPEKWLDEWKYPQVLESNTQTLTTVFGASESLYACDTYQFTDYSRYDITLFDEAAKRAHRDAQFPIDLANARALGKRLVEKAVKKI